MKQIIPLLIVIFLLPFNALAESGGWKSFISAKELKSLIQDNSPTIIDVRSEDAYKLEHIPEAINLPGAQWRTAKTNPGEGDSQYIFRTSDGKPDVARYEALLSNAGITRQTPVVIYGNHAGKADGSVPALLLRWLGHENVAFLDGIGLNEWKKEGYTTSDTVQTLPRSDYKAKPLKHFVWTLDDVKENLSNSSVVFYDTRSLAEFTGSELRSNKRGGHIPGAVRIDYKELLNSDSKSISTEDALKIHQNHGIDKSKTIVLYCQTATRVSLPALQLLDLGYTNIAIYDASWHEYGNRDDTEIKVDAKQVALK